MKELWKIAFTLTGISGVAAFVLWSLYKEWLHVPVLRDLTKVQKYNLLKLFLILTFVFAAAGLLLTAYKDHLASQRVETSVQELESSVASKYEYGKMKLDSLTKKKDLPPAVRSEAEKLMNDYIFLSKNAKDALKNGQFNKFHDITNQINELLRSKKARKLLPDIDPSDMCCTLDDRWDPKSPSPCL